MTPEEHEKELEEWKLKIKEDLRKLGVRVSANALIEPPRRKRYNPKADERSSLQKAFDPVPMPPLRGPSPKEKKPAPRPAPIQETTPRPRRPIVTSKPPEAKPNTEDIFPRIIVHSDGTLSIPGAWRLTESHTAVNRKTIAGTTTILRNLIDMLSKKTDVRSKNLLDSHRKTLRELTRIYL